MLHHSDYKWHEFSIKEFMKLLKYAMFENFDLDSIVNRKSKVFILKGKDPLCLAAEYNIKLNRIEIITNILGSEPEKLYHHFCVQLIKSLKCNINPIVAKFLGIIKKENKIFSIYNLPENLKIEEDVDLSYTIITKLPINLTIIGNLCLAASKIKDLPENLKITGDLNIVYTKIRTLPKSLIVKGTIILDDGVINISNYDYKFKIQ